MGTHYLPYLTAPSSGIARSVETQVERSGAQFALRLAIAFVVATLSARAGVGWGNWMRHLRR